MTQMDAVLKRLSKGPVTPMEAFEELGITRLGGIVYFLRKAGHKIVTNKVKVKNRFGGYCVVAEYTLEEE